MPITSATEGYAGDNAYDQRSEIKAKTGKDQLGKSVSVDQKSAKSTNTTELYKDTLSGGVDSSGKRLKPGTAQLPNENATTKKTTASSKGVLNEGKNTPEDERNPLTERQAVLAGDQAANQKNPYFAQLKVVIDKFNDDRAEFTLADAETIHNYFSEENIDEGIEGLWGLHQMGKAVEVVKIIFPLTSEKTRIIYDKLHQKDPSVNDTLNDIYFEIFFLDPIKELCDELREDPDQLCKIMGEIYKQAQLESPSNASKEYIQMKVCEMINNQNLTCWDPSEETQSHLQDHKKDLIRQFAQDEAKVACLMRNPEIFSGLMQVFCEDIGKYNDRVRLEMASNAARKIGKGLGDSDVNEKVGEIIEALQIHKLPLELRIEFGTSLIDNLNKRSLVSSFQKLGYAKDFRKCSSSEEEIELLQLFSSKSKEWPSLIGECLQAKDMHLFDELNQIKEASSRLKVVESMLDGERGPFVAYLLERNLSDLHLQDAPVEQQLAILRKVVLLGADGATTVLRYIERNLELTAPLQVYIFIAELLENPTTRDYLNCPFADDIIYRFRNFSLLKEVPIDQQAALLRNAVREGDTSKAVMVYKYIVLELASKDLAHVHLLLTDLLSLPETYGDFKRLKDYLCPILDRGVEMSPIFTMLNNPSVNEVNVSEFSEFLRSDEKTKGLAATFEAKIESLVSNLPESDQRFVRIQLMRSVALAAGIIHGLDEERLAAVQKNPEWFTRILELRSPSIRRQLMLATTVISPEEIAKPPEKLLHAFLTRVLLLNMKKVGLLTGSTQVIERRRKRGSKEILESKEMVPTWELIHDKTKASQSPFRDKDKNFNLLCHFLFSLEDQAFWNSEEREFLDAALYDLLGKVEGKAGREEMLRNLRAYSQILDIFGKEDLLNAVRNKTPAEEYFIEHFSELFDGVSKVDHIETRYQQTLGAFRVPSALITYLGAVKSLPSAEQKSVHEALSRFVVATLEGKEAFESMRYAKDGSPHLEKLFSIPGVEMKWRASQKPFKVVTESGYELTASETDDPQDLFMIGTDVQGSCQSVDGTSYFNKCLMGYCLNGEIKSISVKDSSGKIVARSVIRLGLDKEGNPIILQERQYGIEDNNIQEVIKGWAVKKAKEMGIPLVSVQIGSGTPYEGGVSFLQSHAPFVYSDAGGGVKNRDFTVSGCHILYQPDSV